MITRIRVEGTNGSPAALQDDFERVTLAVIAAFGGVRVGEEFYERQPDADVPCQYKGRRILFLPSVTDDGPEEGFDSLDGPDELVSA